MCLLGATKIVERLTTYPSLHRYATINTRVHFFDVLKSHPYCLVDPLCVNVLTDDVGPYLAELPPMAAAHDANVRAGMLSSVNFSWPNFGCFVMLLGLLAAGARLLYERSMLWGLAAVVSVTAWVTSEIFRWAAARERLLLGGGSGNGEYTVALVMLVAAFGYGAGVWFMMGKVHRGGQEASGESGR